MSIATEPLYLNAGDLMLCAEFMAVPLICSLINFSRRSLCSPLIITGSLPHPYPLNARSLPTGYAATLIFD